MVVPTDWKEVRLGDLGSTFGGLTGKSSKDFGDGNSSFVTFMNVMSNVVLNSKGTEKVRIGNGERQSQLLEGDVIFNGSSETPEEVGFGSTVPLELSGLYLNSFCFGFRRKDTKSLDPKFFAYLTRSPLGRDIIRPMAQGSTRYNIAKTNLLNGRFPLPPLKEQEAIAEALSDADAAIESIDALIAKKRDVKQAAKQQLLTGRTRLPGFTADWKEVSIGSFTECKAGGTPSTSVPAYWGGNIRWMSSGELNLKRVREVSGRITQFGLENSSAQLFPADSVLIGLAGQGKTRGTAAINLVSLTTNQSIAGIFPSSSHDSKFLFYVMETKYKALRDLSDGGGGRGGLNLAIIKDVRVTVPELDEQRKISEVLWSMDDELEALTEQVSKLRMIKEGMMQDLLTGKVRLV